VNRVVLVLLAVVFTSTVRAQVDEREKLRELEIQRQADKQRVIDRQIDSVALLIDTEQYEAADKKIMSILRTVKSVPSDVTFYLGINSYYLTKYKQSVDWLTKYIQLKGTAGQFSEEAVEIKRKAEIELVKEKQLEAQQATVIFSKDFDIDCGSTGKVVCPVCNGSTVIIKKGYFGDTYKTCGYCNHAGTLTCGDYNKLLKGQLKPTAN